MWHIHTYSTDNVIKSFHKDVLFYVLLYFNNQQTPSQTKAFLCACGPVCVSVSSKFPSFCVTVIDPAVSLSLASVRTCSLAWKSFELSQVELMAAYHKIPRPRVWRPILKHHTQKHPYIHTNVHFNASWSTAVLISLNWLLVWLPLNWATEDQGITPKGHLNATTIQDLIWWIHFNAWLMSASK